MANRTQQIRIESILGGQSKYVNYAAEDEFLHSYNIDPDISSGFTQSDGVISPTGLAALVPPGSVKGAPMWMVIPPRPSNTGMFSTYIYDAVGSVYKYASYDSNVTFIGDLNDGGSATGNGAAYYDNYVYFARDTTVARYGPLDNSSAASFTDDYWVGVLGKTALTDTDYPACAMANSLTPDYRMPNHMMHRHTDGRLYFADVVGNQGVVHYISTTKTTIEGDTDNDSKYNALDLPYGMWPTALASYGTNLAIALYEGSAGETSNGTKELSYTRAKLAFWDTVSQSYSHITGDEFPDPIIYALLNTNGILYVFSGQAYSPGVRVTRFAGGYTFEQVAFIDHAYPPLAGAVDGYLNRVLFGSRTIEPQPTDSNGNSIPNNTSITGCVWAIGSKKSPVDMSLFNVMGTSSTISSTRVTALKIVGQNGMEAIKPLIGWSATLENGLDAVNPPESGAQGLTDLGGGSVTLTTTYGPPAVFRSKVYRIGQKFKITKVSIPFVQRFDVGDGTGGLTVGVHRDGDDAVSSYVRLGDFTGAPEHRNRLVVRPENLTVDHRFILELVFTSSSGRPYPRVGLPITIDYELIDD